MASISVNPNDWPTFILRWTFAGLWGALGWALAVKYVIPNLPFL